MYNKKLLRYIRKNFDYTDYIQSNLDYKSTNSDEIRVCCPFCNERGEKLYINDNKKLFHCFKCLRSNRNADVFSFVAACENIPVREAIEKLAAQYKDITPEELSLYEDEEITIDSPSFHNIAYIDGMPEDAVKFTEPVGEAATYVDYLSSRGITFQDVLDAGMYYVPKPLSFVYKEGKRVGNIGNRVIWPIYGGSGGLVSWIARSIKSDLPKHIPKYINSPGSELSKTVWPFVPPLGTEIVVVEGIIDALSLRKAGYYSYASFGKKISQEQIDLFKYWGVTDITVFLDHNAKREMISAVNKLRLIFSNIYVVDVTGWPRNAKNEIEDSGSMLTNPNGIAILRNTLSNKINVKNEWEYYKWTII